MINKRSGILDSGSELINVNELRQESLSMQGQFSRKPIGLRKTFLSKLMLFLVVNIFFLSGCMHMGMKIGHTMMKPMMSGSSKTVQKINTGQAIDQMIEEAVLDLSKQNVGITTLAVWKIKSQTAGVDVENGKTKTHYPVSGDEPF